MKVIKVNQAKRKKRIQYLARKAKQTHAAIEAMKVLYTEMDKVTQELIDLGYSDEVKGMRMHDNFEERNFAFRPAAFRRFELKFDKS